MANKYKTLLSNTMFISIGTFGSKLLVFLMVRFYTDCLTTSQYSTSDLIVQTANLLFPIISFGITEGVFRFGMDKAYDRRQVFTYGFLSITAGALMFIGIAPLLTRFEDLGEFTWLIILYTLASCYHALCSQYIRAVGKTMLFAIQGIINTLLVIILNIIFLAIFDMGVTGYVLSVAVADTICAAFLLLKENLWKLFTRKLNRSVFSGMLKYSIPLIPTTVFWWITSVSDRFMVKEMISSDVNGIYTVAYKLPTLLTLVSSIFMQAWQFSAVTEADGERQEHARFYSKVWGSFQAVLFLAGAGVIALCKPAMRLLTTDEFYSAWKYIPLLACSMVFTGFASFTGSVYVVEKKSVLSFVTAFLGAAINIVLNFLLIPTELGPQGAALATLVSYFTVFIIRAVNSKRYIPYRLHSPTVALNTVIIFAQSYAMITEVKYWMAWQGVAIVLLGVINFKFLISSLNKIRSSFLKHS